MAFLGDLLLRLKADTADFQSDLGKASRSATRSFDSIKDSATGLKAALGAIATSAIVVGFEQMAKAVIDHGDELYKMSQKVGISVESLSALEYAGKLADVSLDGLQTGIKKLSSAIVEANSGGREQAALFSSIGVSTREAGGALRSTEDIMVDLADKFSMMDDGAVKTALAVKLFGKAGIDLIPLLNAGRSGIEAMTAEAQRLGLIISTSTAKGMEEFNDNLTRMQAQTQGIKNQFVGSLLPLLLDVQREMLKSANATGSMKSELLELVKSREKVEGWAETVAVGIAHVVDVFSLLKAIAIEIATPIERLGRNLYNLGAISAIALNPNNSLKEKADAWADLRYESELYFESLNKRLKENRDPKTLAADSAKKYFADRKNQLSPYFEDGPQGVKKKLEVDPSALKAHGLSKEQEEKLYSSALQNLEKQMFALNQEGVRAVTIYETTKGSLRELLPDHKKELIVFAEKLDTLKRLDTMRKQDMIGIEAEGAARQRMKDSLLDYNTANRVAADELEFTRSLIGKTAQEQGRLNALRKVDLDLRAKAAEVPVDSEGMGMPGAGEYLAELERQAAVQRKFIGDDYRARREAERSWITGAKEAMDEYVDHSTNAAENIKTSFANAFKGLEDALVNFVKTGKLDFKSLADSIITDIIRMQVRASISSVVGGAVSGGGLFGGMFGKSGGGDVEALGAQGASSGGFLDGVGNWVSGLFKAGGGPVSGGKPYIVGEQGPELMVPGSSGVIIPNGGFGGGGGMTFAPVYNYHIDSRSDRATIEAMLRQSEKRTKDDILQSRQRNGVFAS